MQNHENHDKEAQSDLTEGILGDDGSSRDQRRRFNKEAFADQADMYDQYVQELQESLTAERDRRLEDRFIFIVVVTVLLDVVFFSVLDNFGGPLALLILELLILIPLARRMGMQEFAQLLDRVLNRMAGSIKNKDE